MIATEAVNTMTTSTGKVRLVCQICGRCSSPRPSTRMWDMPGGWTVAPFPERHTHRDGSTGDLYYCAGHSHGGAIGHHIREYLDTPLNASR